MNGPAVECARLLAPPGQADRLLKASPTRQRGKILPRTRRLTRLVVGEPITDHERRQRDAEERYVAQFVEGAGAYTLSWLVATVIAPPILNYAYKLVIK